MYDAHVHRQTETDTAGDAVIDKDSRTEMTPVSDTHLPLPMILLVVEPEAAASSYKISLTQYTSRKLIYYYNTLTCPLYPNTRLLLSLLGSVYSILLKQT